MIKNLDEQIAQVEEEKTALMRVEIELRQRLQETRDALLRLDGFQIALRTIKQQSDAPITESVTNGLTTEVSS